MPWECRWKEGTEPRLSRWSQKKVRSHGGGVAGAPWLLGCLRGARREAKCRDPGHGEGLDWPTPSPSSFTPFWEGLYPGAYTVFKSFALYEDRDGCFWELLAASCEVQLLLFSTHWIFPFLEDQCKIDPRSRAASSSADSTYSSTFPCSSALVGPAEIFAKILRKIPGVLLFWLCKNISAYQATQINAKIFTHSSGGLSFEF